MRSLSEIESAAKRASRAVGLSWGNSEEVGKSIRQLELFGFQGIKNLNQYYKEKNLKKFENLNLIDKKNEPSLEAFCPIILGVSFLDQIRLTNHKAFEDVLAQASGPLRIVCGHIHNSMTVDFAGHIVISGPSTCSSFAFDRSMDATAGYMIKEEGCLLHRWQNGFQSLRVGSTQGLGPFLF
mgnify:CR=1 FL=1